MRTYTFTLDQLLTFLSEFCGITFDATKQENLENLLESQAEEWNCQAGDTPS